MGKIKLILGLTLALLMAAPSLSATTYFGKVATGTTSTKLVMPAEQGNTVITTLVTSMDTVTASVEVKAHILPACGYALTDVATTAGQASIPVASTANFAAEDWVIIQDARDAGSFEAGVVKTVTSGDSLILDANLTYRYDVGARVYEVKNIALYYPWTAIAEKEYKADICLTAAPVGSPLLILLCPTTALGRINVGGYISYGQ